MTRREDTVRLRHMLDASQKAAQFAKNRKRSDLGVDEMFTLALVRLLEIIGEGSRHVSAETRQSYPNVPWTQIAGTRDRLIHGYFDVDLDIVWRIVSEDLPPLITDLSEIISARSTED